MNPQDLKYGADRRPILEKLKDCAELNVNELYRENACHDAMGVIEQLIEALSGVVRTLEAFSYTNEFGKTQRARLQQAQTALEEARRDR